MTSTRLWLVAAAALVLFGSASPAAAAPAATPAAPAAAPAATPAAPAAPAAAARAPAGPAGLIISDDAGLDAATVRTVRALTASAVRRRGVTLLDDARFEQVHPFNEQTAGAVRDLGVNRLFTLKLFKLGSKLLLTLDDGDATAVQPAFSQTLGIGSIEETDRALPRLVDAVVDRRNVADTAGVGTVTSEESRTARKKYGTLMGVIGLTFGFLGSDTKTYQHPFGMNGSLSYEIESWRVDLLGFAESHGSGSTGFLGIGGAYLPLEGDLTPYVSAAVGYSALGGSGGAASPGSDATASGLGLLLGGGVEFLRLHNFRVMAGVDLLVPLYDTASAHLAFPVAPLLHLKVGFL